MLTYQVRQRVFRVKEGQSLVFPNTVEVIFHMSPSQPFGKAKEGGRTLCQNSPSRVRFNANTGNHYTECELQPLDVTIQEPERRIQIQGDKVLVSGRIDTQGDLEEMISTIFFCLPMLLNVEFADPPVVTRVEGTVGQVSFGWELHSWAMTYRVTNQEMQERDAAASWSRFTIISRPGNRRLAAALHYFHVFCRLCRVGISPWEFMAEAIMNLSKILEVLFPASGDTLTIDAARAGLRKLGYEEAQIERDFIPAIALRNNIDAAHVDLSMFTRAQLQVLHTYTERAEMPFRELLSRVLAEVEAGRYEVHRHDKIGHDSRAASIIERLSQHLGVK